MHPPKESIIVKLDGIDSFAAEAAIQWPPSLQNPHATHSLSALCPGGMKFPEFIALTGIAFSEINFAGQGSDKSEHSTHVLSQQVLHDMPMHVG